MNSDEQSDAPKSPVGREFESLFFGGDMGDRRRYPFEFPDGVPHARANIAST